MRNKPAATHFADTAYQVHVFAAEGISLYAAALLERSKISEETDFVISFLINPQRNIAVRCDVTRRESKILP